MDGRLPSAQAEGVREHLEDCPQCVAELEALRETVSLLRRLPAMAPPHSFVLRPGLAAARVPSPMMTWGPLAATAAALFLAVSAALLYTQPWELASQPAAQEQLAITAAPKAAPAAAPAWEAAVPTPAAPLPAVPGPPRLAPVGKAPPGARVLAPGEEARRLPGPEAPPAQPAERAELATPQAGVQDRPRAAAPAPIPAAPPAAPVGEAPSALAHETQPKETHGPRAAAVAAATGAFLFLLLAGGLLLVRAARRRGA